MLKKNKDLLVVLGLLLLGAVPIYGGALRILKLISGDASIENARFLAGSVSTSIHIVSATLYSLFGAFQFSEKARRKWSNWHRGAGKVLVANATLVAVTGLWMALNYPVAIQESRLVFIARVLVGFLMLSFIALGIEAIRLRNFHAHGNWMIRTYALAMGAGTQVFTHMPSILFPSLQGETNRTVAMISGWLINLAVAEWIISRTARPNRSLTNNQSST
jgi:hypothetical protein